MIVVIGAAFCVTACGSDDDDDDEPDAAVAGVALDDLADALADALCPRFVACCSAADLRDDLEIEGVTDEASCQAFLRPATAMLVASWAELVDDGQLRYHADRAEACVAAIATVSCGEFSAIVSSDAISSLRACSNEPVLEPLVAVGGSCDEAFACTTDFCRGEGESRVCAELPGEGQSCPDARCDDAFYCDEIAETCLPAKADGASCTTSDECISGTCGMTGANGVCGPATLCDGVP